MNKLLGLTIALGLGWTLSAPAFAAPTKAMNICGHVYHTESSYQGVDPDGSYYFMKLDCAKNGKTDKGPLARFEDGSLNSHRRGWITRWRRQAAVAAATEGRNNIRNGAPYVCMDVRITSDPCATQKPASVTRVDKMQEQTKARMKTH